MEGVMQTTTSGPATLSLRDYQIECLDAIQAAEDSEIRRQLVVLPTGTGKTIIFANLIQVRPGRALVLAHRDELIQQGCLEATSSFRKAAGRTSQDANPHRRGADRRPGLRLDFTRHCRKAVKMNISAPDF